MPTHEHEFEFDHHKSKVNKDKHGICFGEAQRLWLNESRVEIPARFDDEARSVRCNNRCGARSLVAPELLGDGCIPPEGWGAPTRRLRSRLGEPGRTPSPLEIATSRHLRHVVRSPVFSFSDVSATQAVAVPFRSQLRLSDIERLWARGLFVLFQQQHQFRFGHTVHRA